MEKRFHTLEAMIHCWVLQEEKRQREARESSSAGDFSRDSSMNRKTQIEKEPERPQ